MPRARRLPLNAAGPAQGLGAIAGALAEIGGDLARQEKADLARRQKLDDNSNLIEGTASIERQIFELPETDATAPDFLINRTKAVEKIMSGVLDNLPKLPNGDSVMSPEALSVLEDRAERFKTLDLKNSLDRMRVAHRARANDNIDREMNMISAVAGRSRLSVDASLVAVDGLLEPFAGILDADTLRDKRSKGHEDVLKSYVRGRIAAGDFAAGDNILRSKDFDAAFGPETRNTLLGEIEEAERSFLIRADKEESRAARRLKERADELVKDAYERDADGALTRDGVDALKPHISASQYKGLLGLVDPVEDAADDPEAIIDLTSRLDREDIGPSAARYLRAGELTPATYRSMIQRNREALADDRPASPYKSGRQRVRLTLDPSQILTGPAAKVARVGLANAYVEYDNWAAAHPRATRAEYQAETQAIIRRYQVVTFDQMKLSQGLPRFYGGTREALGPVDLDLAERRALAEFDRGKMGKAQLAEELNKIRNWRGILAAKPPAPGRPGEGRPNPARPE